MLKKKNLKKRILNYAWNNYHYRNYYVDNLPDNELIMTDKKNIYGDFRICYKCGMNADVVESGKDYCASCWFVNHTDMTIDEYERKNKDLEKERFRINYKKDKKW